MRPAGRFYLELGRVFWILIACRFLDRHGRDCLFGRDHAWRRT